MRSGPEVTKKRSRLTAHLSKIFEPYPREIIVEEKNRLLSDITTSAKMVVPTRPFTTKEMRAAIRVLNPEKALCYDLINNQVLQKLSEKRI